VSGLKRNLLVRFNVLRFALVALIKGASISGSASANIASKMCFALSGWPLAASILATKYLLAKP
jgi:hypothetical protein